MLKHSQRIVTLTCTSVNDKLPFLKRLHTETKINLQVMEHEYWNPQEWLHFQQWHCHKTHQRWLLVMQLRWKTIDFLLFEQQGSFNEIKEKDTNISNKKSTSFVDHYKWIEKSDGRPSWCHQIFQVSTLNKYILSHHSNIRLYYFLKSPSQSCSCLLDEIWKIIILQKQLEIIMIFKWGIL